MLLPPLQVQIFSLTRCSQGVFCFQVERPNSHPNSQYNKKQHPVFSCEMHITNRIPPSSWLTKLHTLTKYQISKIISSNSAFNCETYQTRCNSQTSRIRCRLKRILLQICEIRIKLCTCFVSLPTTTVRFYRPHSFSVSLFTCLLFLWWRSASRNVKVPLATSPVLYARHVDIPVLLWIFISLHLFSFIARANRWRAGIKLVIIIIIIIIYCNWVVTRWQWLFYMYTKHEICYYWI